MADRIATKDYPRTADDSYDAYRKRGGDPLMDHREEASNMRIPPETIRSLVGLHASRVSRTGSVGTGSKVATARQTTTSDAVNLSSEAELLNALKQGVKAMPDVDEQRVQAVRDELASGQFEIDPRQVAEGAVLELTGAW